MKPTTFFQVNQGQAISGSISDENVCMQFSLTQAGNTTIN